MASDGSAGLQVNRDRHVLQLILDRPQKANALNATLIDALIAQVVAATSDGTRLLVLRSNGRHFCAGFDFTGFDEQSEGDLLLRFVRIEQLLQAIYHAPFSTLALSQGRAMGAGADLFASCSVRVATPDSSFAFPGARFGLILGTRRLAQRIGASNARRLVASGQPIAGNEALKLGLVDEIVPPESWEKIIAFHAERSLTLDLPTLTTLHRLTCADTRAGDLAELVVSAARPGLKERMRAYRG